jgi:hypothetical protein
MQSAEKKISVGLFYEQSAFCLLQGMVRMTNAWAIAKVASDRQRVREYCLPLMRV